MIDMYEVVTKLTGRINPVGETRTDDERFANLTVLCSLVDKLLSDIDDVAMTKDRVEYSMKRSREAAKKFPDRIGIVE